MILNVLFGGFSARIEIVVPGTKRTISTILLADVKLILVMLIRFLCGLAKIIQSVVKNTERGSSFGCFFKET